jgi:hypothetical protein
LREVQSVLDLPVEGVDPGYEGVQPALMDLLLEPDDLIVEIPMIPGHIIKT